MQHLDVAIAGVQRAGREQRYLRRHERGAARRRGEIRAAEVGLEHRRIVLHLGRRARGDPSAGIERDDCVRHLHHHAHVVLDQHDRDAESGEPAQQRAQARLVIGAEPCGGLVEQQDLWAGRERAGDLDQALVDVRQVVGRAFERIGIADEVEQALGQAMPARLRRPVGERERAAEPMAAQPDQHVVAHGEPGEQLARLEGAGDAGTRHRVRRFVVEPHGPARDRAAVRPIEAAQQVEQRGLAGAVRADHARHFAGPCGEVDVGHGAHAAERDRKSPGLERGAARPLAQERADIGRLAGAVRG